MQHFKKTWPLQIYTGILLQHNVMRNCTLNCTRNCKNCTAHAALNFALQQLHCTVHWTRCCTFNSTSWSAHWSLDVLPQFLKLSSSFCGRIISVIILPSLSRSLIATQQTSEREGWGPVTVRSGRDMRQKQKQESSLPQMSFALLRQGIVLILGHIGHQAIANCIVCGWPHISPFATCYYHRHCQTYYVRSNLHHFLYLEGWDSSKIGWMSFKKNLWVAATERERGGYQMNVRLQHQLEEKGASDEYPITTSNESKFNVMQWNDCFHFCEMFQNICVCTFEVWHFLIFKFLKHLSNTHKFSLKYFNEWFCLHNSTENWSE